MGLYILLIALFIFALVLAIANYAPNHFMTKYKKISNYILDSDYTAGQFAIDIVRKSQYKDIQLRKVDGNVNDCCFISKINAICLDEETIDSNSIASFAVVAHEYGHAIQHNSGDKSFKLLTALKSLSILLGRFAFPLMIIGAIVMVINIEPAWIGYSIVVAGAVIFIITIIAQLITISIEYKASDIGLAVMTQSDKFGKKSIRLARKLLRSAGLTYIGAFFSSILSWTLLVPKYNK